MFYEDRSQFPEHANHRLPLRAKPEDGSPIIPIQVRTRQVGIKPLANFLNSLPCPWLYLFRVSKLSSGAENAERARGIRTAQRGGESEEIGSGHAAPFVRLTMLEEK